MGFFLLIFLNLDFVKRFSEDEGILPLTFKAEKLSKWTTFFKKFLNFFVEQILFHIHK